MKFIEIFERNEQKADALQEKYGLNMTMRDLYASELITETEAIKLQTFVDKIRPTRTGDEEVDTKLFEAFYAETEALNLTEDLITDPGAKKIYDGGSLNIREALELQRIRSLNS